MAFIDPRKQGFVDPRKQGFIDPRATQQENPEDTQPLTTLGMLGQEAKAAIDTIAWPFDTLGNIPYVMGLTDTKDPVSELIDLGQEYFTGDTRENFVPKGVGRDVANSVGTAAAVIPGFMPVQRAAGNVSSVAYDLLGLGMSEADDFARMAQKTAQSLADSDAYILGKPGMETVDELYDEVVRLSTEKLKEKNRPLLDEYTKALRDTVKKAKVGKRMKKGIRKLIDEGDVPRAREILERKGALEGVDLPQITPTTGEYAKILRESRDEIVENYGKKAEEVDAAIFQRDKATLTTDEAVRRSFESQHQYRQANGIDKPLSKMDYFVQPVADVLRKYVDTRIGGIFEKAAETATRMESILPESMIKPANAVVKLVSEDRQLKRYLLDLHLNQGNLDKARGIVFNKLGEEGVKQFDDFIAKSQKFNERIQKVLYKADPKIKVGDVYIHAEKNVRRGLGKDFTGVPRFGASDTMTPSALKDRRRPPAWKMSDDEVDQYMNPLISQVKHIADAENLIQVSNAFHLRPGLKTNGNVSEFFQGMQQEFIRRGMTSKKAKMAAEAMNYHYMGMQHAPSPAIRAIMSLGYAGTLAQLKSATLNLADIGVSMLNQGVRPTMKALVTRTKGEFAKNLNQLGLDNSQNVGEFVRHFDRYIETPSMGEKLARTAHRTSDGAMFVSGFKLLDRTGKGVILRSAVNQARNSARKGTLVKDFGDVMTADELRLIRPWLQKGSKAKDMPPKVAEKVEQLAFTALGKQQLISAAGRPMAYLKHPIIRPAYAMTGFAIKQLAMLRRGIFGEMKRGNAAGAAKYAAQYFFMVGMGTGLINELRGAAFQNKEFAPEDVVIGGIEQLAAVATLNKIGDPYSLQQASGNTLEFFMNSFIPPLGLFEAGVDDFTDVVFMGKEPSRLAEKTPLLGDFYKYYWSDKKPADRGTNTEQYKKFFEQWGERE